MRWRWLIWVVVLTATLTFVSVAAALDKPTVLRFVDVTESFTGIDEFPIDEEAFPAVGTRLTFRDGLYKWAGRKRGERVGKLDAFCTELRIFRKRFEARHYCVAEAKVPGGRISFAGFITFGEPSPVTTLPVIGGTRRFANARGTVKIRDLPSGASAFVFRLTP